MPEASKEERKKNTIKANRKNSTRETYNMIKPI